MATIPTPAAAIPLDQFQSAFLGLNPTEQANYVKSNPTVMVGGQPLTYSNGKYSAPATGSTLGTLVNAPTSPSNAPASSATAPQNAAGAAAVAGTTQPPQPAPQDQSAAQLASAYSSQGVNITADQIQKWIDAGYDPKEAAAQAAQYYQSNQERQNQLNTQQQEYQAELAKENADYAAATAKLNVARTAAVHAGVAQAAKSGVFENQSSDQVAYGNAINRTYDNLQVQLDQAAESAKAAAAAGNFKAVAQINASMDSLLQQGLAQIATRQQTEQQQKQTAAAQKATLEANTQAKATTAFQNALKTPSITSANADLLSNLPSNWNDMTPAQQKQAMDITGGLMNMAQSTGDYNDASGNFSPALAWTAVQGGLTNSIAQQKATSQINAANLRAVEANIKLANMQTETTAAQGYFTNPQGTYFASAYNNLVNAGTGLKDSVNPGTNLTTYGSIGRSLSVGDLDGAKQQLLNLATGAVKKIDPNGLAVYQSFAETTRLFSVLNKDIALLPPQDQTNIINGTIESVGEYFGSNPKGPQAAKVINDINLIKAQHGRFLGGVRGLSPNEFKYLTNVLPNYSDINTLNISAYNSFQDVTNQLGQDVYGDVIGPDNYNAIFGTGAPSSLGGTSSSANATSTSTGGGFQNWLNTNIPLNLRTSNGVDLSKYAK